MTENNNKTKRWKIAAGVIIAALGLAGTLVASWAKVRTGENTDSLRQTITHLNTSVANLEKRTDKLQAENKILADVGIALRERVSSLEGRHKERSALMEWINPRAKEPDEVKLDKVLTRAKPAPIPKLHVQQMAE